MVATGAALRCFEESHTLPPRPRRASMAGRARIFEVKETRVFVQDRGRLERGERKLPVVGTTNRSMAAIADRYSDGG